MESQIPECGACRDDEPDFDKARSFGVYTGHLRRVILRMKFGREERLGRRLGELLVYAWNSLAGLSEGSTPVIIPVPLHPSRRRERGFNQAEMLARGLVKALGKGSGASSLAVSNRCLARKRATPPQTGLSVSARRENLRGAFEVVDVPKIRERMVVVIDDVMTTGATLSACARALKHAGAVRVFGLTLARATPQFPDLASAADDIAVDGPNRDWR